MANVDLVDLLPILKAILRVKEEYKLALDTTEVDFGVYPVLTENFLDKSYNEGYVVGFKQAWNEYLGNSDVDVAIPREMRDVVPTNFSVSGSQDYDTLTDIMVYCLGIRQNLKTILDLDTDLFELYPPRLLEMSLSQYTAGVNDGYIDGINSIGQTDVTPPEINNVNNSVVINTTFPGAVTYYMIGAGGEWTLYDNNTFIPIPEDTSFIVYAYSVAGTKNSEVVSKEVSYNAVITPTISFSNNTITIQSNYTDNTVKTKYKLSSWENYNEFVDYDFLPIPITDPTMVWAYNEFEDGSVSDTVSLTCNPTSEVVVRPATPQILYSPETQVVSINCSTPNALIYYKKQGANNWVLYNGAFKIMESGTYTAMAVLDGVESDISNTVTCVVGSSSEVTVYAPTIIPNNNNVSVFTTQSGVTLYIQNLGFADSANNIGAGEWVQYTGPFTISMTNQYQAKAVLNSDNTKFAYSTITECKYSNVTPGGNTPGGGSGSSDAEYVAAPLIYFNKPIVSIVPVTTGSTIKYRIYGTTEWIDYSVPFSISESTIIQAKAIKNGYESSIAEINCVMDATPEMTCYMEFENNTLTITSNVTGGTIYYKTTNTNWQVYTGPITVAITSYYYSKVVKGENESSIFGLYCEVPVIDYGSIGLTIQFLEAGNIYFEDKYTSGGYNNPGVSTFTFKLNDEQPVDWSFTVPNNGYYDFKGFKTTGFDIGDVIEFTSLNLDSTNKWHITGKVKIYGNLAVSCPTISTYQFYEWFSGCSSIQDISHLLIPYATIPSYACENMFRNCIGLTSIPSGLLSGATIQSEGCSGMFTGCTGLTSIPSGLLSGTSIKARSCESMFENCTGLTTVSNNIFENAVIVTTDAQRKHFYNMFKGCTSLTAAPNLPATTLGMDCYEGMFENCTSLTNAPALPATTLKSDCYRRMFAGCTSLTTAPILPAATLQYECYYEMFTGCSSLNYVKCLADDLYGSSATRDWLKNVASTGTFVKKTGVDWYYNGIPSGWTVQESNS